MRCGFLILLASSVLLSSCATLMNSSYQKITVDSYPTSASCTLSNGVGTWTVTTPAVLTIKRSPNDLEVSCQKAGFGASDHIVTPHMQLIGKETKANYPSPIMVKLLPEGSYSHSHSRTRYSKISRSGYDIYTAKQ